MGKTRFATPGNAYKTQTYGCLCYTVRYTQHVSIVIHEIEAQHHACSEKNRAEYGMRDAIEISSAI